MRRLKTLSGMLLFLIVIPKLCDAQRYAFFTYPSHFKNTLEVSYSEEEIDRIQRYYNFRKLDSRYLYDKEFEIPIDCDKMNNLAVIIEIASVENESLPAFLGNIGVSSAVKSNDDALSKFFSTILSSVKENDQYLIIDIDSLASTAFSYPTQQRALLDKEPRRVFDFCQLTNSYGFELKLPFVANNPTTFRIVNEPGNFPSNEPRQYVTIYEKPEGERKASPIWWLEKNHDPLRRGMATDGKLKFSPYQKYKVIGKNSLLEIRFDQEAIARNINFQGSISLAARSGEKKIEVAPYFVIGEEQKTLGVSAMPIKEIADYFLRLMIEANNYDRSWKELTTNMDILSHVHDSSGNTASQILYERDRQISIASAQRVTANALASVDAYLFTVDSLHFPISYDEDLVQDLYDVNYYVQHPVLEALIKDMSGKSDPNRRRFRYNDLKAVLSEIRASYKNHIAELFNDPYYYRAISEGYYGALQQDRAEVKVTEGMINEQMVRQAENLRLLYELLKRIKESNTQTINAFLSFTILTITDFDDIFRKTEDAINEIERGNLMELGAAVNSADNATMQQDLLRIFRTVNPAYQAFINSSVLFNELLLSRGYSPGTDSIQEQSEFKSLKKLTQDAPAYNIIRDQFALFAGREIFKRLVYANIDVSKANVDEGDELVISVMWYNSDGNVNGSTDNTEDAVELATAKFIVKKVGWDVDVSESALLIHRIDEEKLRPDYPLSPSNFKPTAGASLTWTYYNPHRTKVRTKKDHWFVNDKNVGVEMEYGFIKFLHWLEPSFGINVSYTDFRTDRDVEFGAGPVIGLFRNSIFVTTGYAFSVNGESPFYMGIGFSFSNIYEHAKNGNNGND
jgi:hypothetical protein